MSDSECVGWGAVFAISTAPHPAHFVRRPPRQGEVR